MCGIIGVTVRNEDAVREAAATFAYRGPDAFGYYVDDRVTLGHNRLSIIDLDARSTQPFFDPEEEIGLVFNGEIYNYQALRERLIATGRYTFRTTSDTEVVLYAYKEWGTDMFKELSGMFALAVYDRPRGIIGLATDHMAMKPLFYSHDARTFMFASEVKGVAALRKRLKLETTVSTASVDLALACGYVPPPRTLFTDICRLEEGRWLVYEIATDQIHEERYEPYVASVKERDDKEILEESVEAHLVADVPVGLFYSGGIDSSLVAAALRARDHELSAYTIDIAGRPDDGIYAKRIADVLAIPSHTHQFDIPEFDSAYEDIITKLDEPTYDTALFSTYFVAKKAAADVKVVLSGDGGDELFFGYPRSLTMLRMRDLKKDVELSLIEHVFFLLPRFRAKNKIFSIAYRFLGLPVAYYLMESSPAKDLLTKQAWQRAKQEIARRGRNPATFDIDLFLIGSMLRKTDLAGMYASVEGRLPLLDPRMVQLAVDKQPEKDEREPKRVLKELLARSVPSELVYRRKSGFQVPSQRLFEQSRHLRSDLRDALAYLADRSFITRWQSQHELERRYPGYCMTLITLHHVLKNAEHW